MRLTYFPRHELAEEMINALLGRSLFGDEHNGLFLAAPRRTGKTTFLRSDLTPALEAQGVVVVYVDLWSDQRQNPAALISRAIAAVMERYRSQLEKLMTRSGVTGIDIGGWISFKRTAAEESKPGSIALSEALDMLIKAADAPVALIIDEAQQALTSQEGEALMVALKSARDQLNTPDGIHLMLVMSGSDRDKLLRLVNSHAAPFFGSQIRAMPMLDQTFVDHLAALIERHGSVERTIDRRTLGEAFAAFGYRPQYFMSALNSALGPMTEMTGSPEQAVLEEAVAQREADRDDMASLYLGLSPLQQAVLWRLLDQQSRFRPYDGAALDFYRRIMAQQDVPMAVTPQKVQTALEALRDRTPPLVWKSARGEYAVEDAGMYDWYQDRMAQEMWPPVYPA